MSEAFNSFGPVEWFSEQFADPSAASMFRLVLVVWAVLALVSIVLDRLGSLLLGRSRPLAQHPPERARAWRWGQLTPPENYSLLPPGIAGIPRLEPEVPLERPLALPPGDEQLILQIPDESIALDDDAFWRLFADDSAPIFGFENGARIARGSAPERYNPITGRVEQLVRNADGSTLSWSWGVDGSLTIGGGDR
jgi:hypothetical protein